MLSCPEQQQGEEWSLWCIHKHSPPWPVKIAQHQAFDDDDDSHMFAGSFAGEDTLNSPLACLLHHKGICRFHFHKAVLTQHQQLFLLVPRVLSEKHRGRYQEPTVYKAHWQLVYPSMRLQEVVPWQELELSEQ